METLIKTVLPIVACLALGKAMTYMALFRSLDWPSLEKVMFWVFLPILIFKSIAEGEFNVSESVTLAWIFAAAQALMAACAILYARFAKLSAASMTSLFQNAVRWNNIVPIALVTTLYGNAGMSIVAVALAIMVPIANISSIIVMEHSLNREASSWKARSFAVLTNPLVVACIAGGAVKLTGLTLPGALTGFLNILGSSTLGVGLLVVGANINFGAMSRDILNVAFATAMKIVVMPLVTLGFCLAFGITGLALVVAVICTASPTAMQGLIVARNMGGDAELMSSAITVEHVLVVMTIPIMMVIASYFYA
jgi:malonate transporter and related proteins